MECYFVHHNGGALIKELDLQFIPRINDEIYCKDTDDFIANYVVKGILHNYVDNEIVISLEKVK